MVELTDTQATIYKVEELIKQWPDPDLTAEQMTGHQMNVLFEIQQVIEQYRKRVKKGLV